MGKPNESAGAGRLRFILGLFAKAFRHPLLMLKNLKPRNIRALIKKLRSGDVGRADELVGYTLSVSGPLKKRLKLLNAKKTRHDALAIPQFASPYTTSGRIRTRACRR